MKTIQKFRKALAICLLAAAFSLPVSAHCDSYDGPLIKDALQAIETNRVTVVLKWVAPEYEEEVTNLFNKTIRLKQEDQEQYAIVEKQFLETLVRLHREGEGAPFTGLKPAGSASGIVLLADEALAKKDIESLIENLNIHLADAVREKYKVVAEKAMTKDNSVAEGREYVHAYVEYTHLLEALHSTMTAGHAHEDHAE